MAREESTPPALIHHYTHVVCALSETRKGAVSDGAAALALDNTIKGVCQLIDALVAGEMPNPRRAN